jgi:hypothetical protein
MESRCCQGLGILIGAATTPAKKYLVLHIENPNGLVAHEKGQGIAWATNMLVPEFIENTIYDHVRDDMIAQFREKGSEVTIDIMSSPPKGEKLTSDLGGGVLLGIIFTLLSLGAIKVASRG